MLAVASDPAEVCCGSGWLGASRNEAASSAAELGKRMHPCCRNALPLLEEMVKMQNSFFEGHS